MLTEKTFDTGELTLNYAEGPNNGPPMVLLHGLTSDWHAWMPIVPYLESWHVYAVDLRGHGKSGRVKDKYLLGDQAGDIVAFLRDHLTEPGVVMGHSLGAAVALAATSQVPDHVRGLIPLDPPLFNRNADISAAKGAKEYFGWVYEMLTTAQSYDEILARCEAAGMKDYAPTLAKLSPDPVTVALKNQLFVGYDLAAAFQRITCPTLLLYGDWQQGAVMRDEDMQLVQANIPNVTIVLIPDGTHGFLWEQTDLTMKHIQDFLATV